MHHCASPRTLLPGFTGRAPFAGLGGLTALAGLLLGVAAVAAGCASVPVATTTPAPVCPTATAAALPVAVPAPARAASVDDVMRELVAAYTARDPKRSIALLDASMQALSPLDKEPAWIDQMLSKGPFLEAKRVGGDGAVHGVYELTAERGAFRIELHVDAEGKIAGLLVKPLKHEPPVVSSTLPIALPFKGS